MHFLRHQSQAARLATGLLTAFLTACGGGDGGTPPGSISVSASPGSLTVQQGSSGTVAVTITRTNLSGTVTVSAEGMPTGVTATVSPSALSGTTTTANVAVAVAATTTPGSYPITVRAAATGVGSQTTTYTLTVVPPPDFALATSASSVSLSSAVAGTATISITRTGGFSGAVTFSMQSAQAGLSAVFAPTSTAGVNTVLTISATPAVPIGVYPVTIVGNGVGIGDRMASISVSVVAPPDFALSATPSPLTITAGTSGSASVAIARSGGFASSVALTLQSAQVGITGTFSPATTTGATAALSISVASTVPPGTYPTTVAGSASGLSDRTVLLSITVLEVPRIALSLSPSSLTIAAGGSNTSSVSLVRTNFAGAVSLAASGAPSGVAVLFAPASLTSTSSVATVTVDATVPAGSYSIAVAASGAGVTTVTSPLSLMVTAPSSNVEYRFCATGVSTGEGSWGAPAWLAFQSGNGAWTRVLPMTVGDLLVYRFTVTGPVGAVAFVNEVNVADNAPRAAHRAVAQRAASNTLGSFAASVFITTFRYGTRDELVSLGAAGSCGSFPPAKRHTGTVAGLQANTTGRVWLGGSTSSQANPNYSVFVRETGPQTLLAQRVSSSFLTDRLLLLRDVNQADNSVLPLLDFGSASSFAPLERSITIVNGLADLLEASANLISVPGALGIPILNGTASAATTRTFRTIPLDRRLTGEVDELLVSATRSLNNAAVAFDYEQRSVWFIPITQGVDATVTVGARLVTPTITAINGAAPFALPRLNGTIPVDYSQRTQIDVRTTGQGQYAVRFSDAYRTAVGSGNAYEFTYPDFRAVPGFIPASMITRGLATISTFSEGWSGGGPTSPVPGRAYRSVVRQQDASF